MDQCTSCGTETTLHVYGLPLCPSCDDLNQGITSGESNTTNTAAQGLIHT
jgi:hypothetical protein